MNYALQYQKLCDRGQIRQPEDGIYYEKHHILPKCLGGTNDKTNITLITAREHFIAHMLLFKMHQHSTTRVRVKLAAAISRMCWSQKERRKLSSRQIAVAREVCAKNGVFSDPEFKIKNQRRVDQQKQERLAAMPLCKCGCGEKLNGSTHCNKRGYLPYHLNVLQKQERLAAMPLCKCGCGQKLNHKKDEYLHNHWNRSTAVNWTPEKRQKLSIAAKRKIAKLTPEQEKERLAKSLHGNNVDHVARGKAISAGKKGKKTNQYEITGRRLAQLNDNEFKEYLSQKDPWVWTRMTNQRNKWMNKK